MPVLVANDNRQYHNRQHGGIWGGGLYCDDASPIIANNLITANTAEYNGGGVLVDSGSPLITENTISGNRAIYGGGIYLQTSATTQITNNIITQNEASFVGGGISDSSSSVIASNSITANRASYGGGIRCTSGAPLFLENLIADNVSTFGAGILAAFSSPILCANIISGNHAGFIGGGVGLSHSTVVMAGDVIAGNTADTAGGLDIGSSSVSMTNVVITQNYARRGASIIRWDSTLSIVNSIIWSNYETRWVPIESTTASEDTRPEAENQADPHTSEPTLQEVLAAGLVVTVRYSAIPSSYYRYAVGGVIVATDPMFVDPGHWDDNGTPDDQDDDFFVMGDYRLLPDSPCIDAGTNDIDDPGTEPIEELPETDPNGLPRIIDGDLDGTATVDIGAYEYLPGDVNYDGKTNVLDLLHVRNNFGKDPSSDPAARRADVNADGKVDIMDLIAVRNLLSAW